MTRGDHCHLLRSYNIFRINLRRTTPLTKTYHELFPGSDPFHVSAPEGLSGRGALPHRGAAQRVQAAPPAGAVRKLEGARGHAQGLHQVGVLLRQVPLFSGRAMLPDSSSRPLAAKWPNHTT